jgi:hypothetical protein
MRKIAWIVALIATLAVVFWLFWRLGDLPRENPQSASLQIYNGIVERKTAGSQSWIQARDGETLQAGDALRTGKDSSAVVTFYDRAQIRLTPGSQIDLAAATQGDGATSFAVRIKLVSGRAWSRVLRLFSLNDIYSVAANDVVATVRGTAFDTTFQPSGASFAVLDSAIEVARAVQGAQTPLVVSQGFRVNFDGTGKLTKTELLGDDFKQSEWISGNLRKDEAFVHEKTQKLESDLRALGGQLPGGVMDGLTRVSERLHLALDAKAAPALFSRYAARHLYQVLVLYKEGQSGSATQALARLEDEISLQASRGTAYQAQLARMLTDFESILREVGPSSPLYRMKQRIEDLQLRLASGDALDSISVRLRSIDARLDETDSLIEQSSLDDAKDALEAARQGIINIEIEIDRLPDTQPRDRVGALRGKLNVLKAREAATRIKLATALEPPKAEIGTSPGESAGSTGDLSASSTIPTATSTVYVTLSLTASPAAPVVGDTVTLKAFAETLQGKKTDVTAMTKFNLTGSARLNGPTIYTVTPGTLTLSGEYTVDSTVLSARLYLNVKAKAITLQKIRLVPNGSTTLGYGQELPLTVFADYSDGTARDVTAQTTFSSSNLLLGFLTGSLFHAASNSGTARVGATYAEAGKTVTAYLDLVIQPRAL